MKKSRFDNYLKSTLRLFKGKNRISDDYKNRINNEIANYRHVENVHELPDIFHYWSNKYLLPKAQEFGFNGAKDFYLLYLNRIIRSNTSKSCRFISIGAGNCDIEVEIVKQLCDSGHHNFRFECIDLNSEMLSRGKELAIKHDVFDRMEFLQLDIKSWKSEEYQAIIANQSLHHFLDLEILFEKIQEALSIDGYFLTDDMIGRNGHKRWPEALAIIKEIWKDIPERYRYNRFSKSIETEYINHDCSKESFEGIRAQDILPLLIENFHFEFFLAFGNVIFPFIDRVFGHNFDANNDWDKQFIDRVHELDENKIEQGVIKPTQMIAAMTKEHVKNMKTYKHLTPEFCVRLPNDTLE